MPGNLISDDHATKPPANDLSRLGIERDGVCFLPPHGALRGRLKASTGKAALVQSVITGDCEALDLSAKHCLYDLMEDIRAALKEANEALAQPVL